MQTVFIETTNGSNWGKFMVGRFEAEEWARSSQIGRNPSLLAERQWTPDNVVVVDLQTGEGAIFRPGGSASNDLNHKHQVWVCPMFEPFLTWLYRQDLQDLAALPNVVEFDLDKAPFEQFGYRRTRSA